MIIDCHCHVGRWWLKGLKSATLYPTDHSNLKRSLGNHTLRTIK